MLKARSLARTKGHTDNSPNNDNDDNDDDDDDYYDDDDDVLVSLIVCIVLFFGLLEFSKFDSSQASYGQHSVWQTGMANSPVATLYGQHSRWQTRYATLWQRTAL